MDKEGLFLVEQKIRSDGIIEIIRTIGPLGVGVVQVGLGQARVDCRFLGMLDDKPQVSIEAVNLDPSGRYFIGVPERTGIIDFVEEKDLPDIVGRTIVLEPGEGVTALKLVENPEREDFLLVKLMWLLNPTVRGAVLQQDESLD